MPEVNWNFITQLAKDHDVESCFVLWLAQFTDRILRALLVSMIDEQIRKYEILKDRLRRETQRYNKLSNAITASSNLANSYLDTYYRMFELFPIDGLADCVEGTEFFDTFLKGAGRVSSESRASDGSVFESIADIREELQEQTYKLAQVTRATNWTALVTENIDSQLEQLAKHRGLIIDIGV